MKTDCIGFVFHPERQETVSAARRTVEIAKSLGFRCVVDPKYYPDFPEEGVYSLNEYDPDFIAVLGGDGTILRASFIASSRGIPLLGINMGRVGFLSEISIDEFPSALAKIKRGEFTLDRRMMLSGSVNGGEEYTCLNDFLLYKRSFSGVAHIAVTVNGQDAGSVYCDGLIASTPTGATGYSISSGGPVIAPGLEAAIVTPICPHSLSFRPIVCAKNASLDFEMKSDGYFSHDGQQVRELSAGDRVHIIGAEKATDFIRFESCNLYRLIREKLL